jgi:hypothetical protein
MTEDERLELEEDTAHGFGTGEAERTGAERVETTDNPASQLLRPPGADLTGALPCPPLKTLTESWYPEETVPRDLFEPRFASARRFGASGWGGEKMLLLEFSGSLSVATWGELRRGDPGSAAQTGSAATMEMGACGGKSSGS